VNNCGQYAITQTIVFTIERREIRGDLLPKSPPMTSSHEEPPMSGNVPDTAPVSVPMFPSPSYNATIDELLKIQQFEEKYPEAESQTTFQAFKFQMLNAHEKKRTEYYTKNPTAAKAVKQAYKVYTHKESEKEKSAAAKAIAIKKAKEAKAAAAKAIAIKEAKAAKAAAAKVAADKADAANAARANAAVAKAAAAKADAGRAAKAAKVAADNKVPLTKQEAKLIEKEEEKDRKGEEKYKNYLRKYFPEEQPPADQETADQETANQVNKDQEDADQEAAAEEEEDELYACERATKDDFSNPFASPPANGSGDEDMSFGLC
jgi:colicin import membrane protein